MYLRNDCHYPLSFPETPGDRAKKLPCTTSRIGQPGHCKFNPEQPKPSRVKQIVMRIRLIVLFGFGVSFQELVLYIGRNLFV